MATQNAHDDLRFRDLGPLLVERVGVSRPVGGARLEAALALLLIHAGSAVGADTLTEAMWGEQGVTRSAATLDSHVWRLRRLLEPDRAAGAPPAVLLREPGGYRLDVPPGRIDSVRFAALAAEAAALLADGQADRALPRAEEATALWRGRPYGSAADRLGARAAVARLEEIRGRLRETHIGALVGTGALDRALAELEIALPDEPLRERLWAYRMAAYRDSGRRSDALATYAEARAVLVDELGLEPGPELRAVQATLLREDAADHGPPPGPSRAPRPEPPVPTLPPTRARLVGRDRELAELLDLLGSRALVTLAGPAGGGKTRLAVEATRRAAPRHLDGVWFVDLTAATPGSVVDTVTSTLELPIAGPADPVEALRRHTASHRMLLVLDNCEHVLDAVADLVDALLGDAVGDVPTVLATSREPLEVDGEHVLRLAPLPRPAAVELLLERLEGPVPDGSLAEVDEIAVAVDGLPLALELAAGRARAYTLTEIAAQVRADASTLSRVGRRRSGPGAGTHHRTVRDAIDTSYRVLPVPLAALHRATGVVPGPFTAQLAAGLVGDAVADVMDALADLAHRSLLTPLGPARPGGASRFAQLATVRGHAVHAAARLGEDLRAARDAWVERLVRARPALGSTRHVGWYRALDDDLAALRATVQHTLADAPSATGVAVAARLGVYWAFSGMGLEGVRWLRTAAEAGDADPGLGRPAERAAVHVDLGAGRFVQGRAAEGRAHLRAGMAEGRDVTGDDAVLLCAALTVAAGAVARAGDGEVLGELAAAARRTAAGSAALDVAVRHVELVHATIIRPGPELVPRYLALHRDARAEDNLYTAWLAAANAARLLLAAGRTDEAVGWARAAVRASAEAGLRVNAYALEVYGTALGRAGEHAAALRVFGAVERQHRGAGVVWPWDGSVAALITGMAARVGAAVAARVRDEGARATLAELADA